MEHSRFWATVDIKEQDDCWNWTGKTLTHGYGRFWMNGKLRRANRVVWEITNGPIPLDKQVLHKCDNKLCVNPNHLYLGTPGDNICDAVTRGRGQFAHMRCVTGYGNKRFTRLIKF